MQFSVAVLGQVDDLVFNALERWGVVVYHCAKPSGCNLYDIINKVDGVIVRSPFVLDDDASRHAPNLTFIIRAGAGTDNISSEFERRGVQLRATSLNASSVAELTVGLILALYRKIMTANASLKAGEWKKSSLIGREVQGKTVGLLGFGNIGRAVAKLLYGFGANLIAYDRSPEKRDKDEASRVYGVKFVALFDLLVAVDILVVCLPGTNGTSLLLGKSELVLLRADAILVNVGRGSILDTEFLTEQLRCGLLSGAALDVFEVEPPGNLSLFDLENVVCTPHLGAQTKETHQAIGNRIVEHLEEFLGDGFSA